MLGLFRRAAGHRLYIARITGVEVAAALTRKHRGAHLRADEAARALARVRRDLGKRLRIIEFTHTLLTEAMALAEKHGLRGYDALQLAAVLEANSERLRLSLSALALVTADNELLVAGAAEGSGYGRSQYPLI